MHNSEARDVLGATSEGLGHRIFKCENNTQCKN